MPKHSKPNVALVVDNPVRDLPGLVLLAMELAKQGARAFLVPMKLQIPEIYLCSPDYVLLPYARVNNEALIEDLVSRGVKVGVLETEGAVFEDNTHIRAKSIAPSRIRELIHQFFVWGETPKLIINQEGWYNEQQLIATGSPRFDFYSTHMRNAVKAIEPTLDGYSLKPLILFIGGAPTANPRFATKESEAYQLVSKFNHDASYIAMKDRIQTETIETMTQLVNQIAQRFPDANIVFRPHPFEDDAIYYEKLNIQQYKNLYISRIGSIDQWIVRSTLLIQRGSTTSLEAAMCDLPVFTPTWMPIIPVKQRDKLSIEIETPEEFFDNVERLLNNKWEFPPHYHEMKKDILNGMYGEIDGMNHQRVGYSIMQFLSSNTEQYRAIHIKNQQLLDELFLPQNTVRQKIREMLIRYLHLPLNLTLDKLKTFYQPIPWDSSEKRFTVDDVQKIIDAVVNHVEDFGNIRYQLKCGVFPQHRYLHGRTIVVETAD